jgi:CheY-like chemotaxis protein
MQEKIFERFRQANNTIQTDFGGAGLGLAISKALVELLSGKIWVQSQIDKGYAFYFTFPYKAAQNNNKSVSGFGQNESEITILVAEDEEYNFLYIRELLNKLKIITIHARNGNEAIELCKANQTINLVLMDLKMPIISGQDAAIEIKAFRPGLPIIAQTAYATQQEIDKYSGSHFNEYITKPINEAEFRQKIMKYLGNDKQST